MNSSSNRPVNQDSDPTIFDLLNLSPEKRRILIWMQRQQQFSLLALTQYLGQSKEQVFVLVEEFLKDGLIQVIGGEREPRYQIALGSTHRHRHQGESSSIFDALIEDF